MATWPIATAVRRHIRVRGVVQGVGFRPFVYTLARSLGLSGYVFNSSSGVTIEVEGEAAAVEAFVQRLREEAPPLARVDDVVVTAMVACGGGEFSIRESQEEVGRFGLVPADAGTCAACWREFGDPAESAVWVSVYQLHALRAAVHDHPRCSVRSRDDDDGAVHDVCGVRARVQGSGGSAVSCAAECVWGVRAVAGAGAARGVGGGDRVCGSGRAGGDPSGSRAAA